MSKDPLIYLCGADVRQALPMADAMEAMRDAYRWLASGQVVMPPRTRLDMAESKGLVLLMPCRSAGQRMSLKVIHQFANNREVGLPLIQALVILGNGANGEFQAIMDGATLTAIRTGAASGVATEVLARPDADRAAIFGAGVQGRTQLEAVCQARAIQSARVYDADIGAAEKFAAEMSTRLKIHVEPARNAAHALEGAAVVCTATTSSTPVFKDKDLLAGAHINAVGSWKPTTSEIPPETVVRARIFVDQREAALEEAGDLLGPWREGRIGPEHFRNELGDLLLGRTPGRQSTDEITLFKSVGLAVQDLAAATRAYENARRMGIGIGLPR